MRRLMKYLEFANEDEMPILGLGTWKSEPGEVYNAVLSAIKAGYRHIDCAPIYGNEPEVGEALTHAITSGWVDREDLWITSKLWNNAHRKEQVKPALKSTLIDLNLDYIDLYLIHWPVVQKEDVGFPESGDDFLSLEEVPLEETWQGMESAKEQGLVRHIGVSNFNRQHVKSLQKSATHPPEMNQVELHPFLQQQDLVDYCQENDVHVTAYSPLGSMDRPERLKQENEPILLEHPVINDIAKSHDVTPAQVLIRWAIQRGTAVIPKSVNDERIRENFNSLDLELTNEDMKRISELDRGFRYVDGTLWTMEGSPYTLETLWD